MTDVMTDELIYNRAGYRNMVKMSKFKYILVEGRDDKIALLYLIYELFGKRPDLRVHGAYQIQFGSESSSIGNRERVEEIAESIGSKKFGKRFVGFVDREFRGYNFKNGIEDKITNLIFPFFLDHCDILLQLLILAMHWIYLSKI